MRVASIFFAVLIAAATVVSAESLWDFVPKGPSSLASSSSSPAQAYLAAKSSADVGQPPQPIRAGGMCRDVNGRWPCPEYEYYPAKGLEFRQYDNVTVAYCTEAGPPGGMLYSVEECYGHIDRYFHGHNERNVTLERTAPLLIQATAIGVAQTVFTTQFFLPMEHSRNPPRPRSPFVHIGHIPVAWVAVLQFAPTPFSGETGWEIDYRIYDTAAALEFNLFTYRVRFDNNMFLFAEYNAPGTQANRRREIWYHLGDRTSQLQHSIVDIDHAIKAYKQH